MWMSTTTTSILTSSSFSGSRSAILLCVRERKRGGERESERGVEKGCLGVTMVTVEAIAEASWERKKGLLVPGRARCDSAWRSS